MAKRRVALTHRKQRSVLTDMLPFEVPPTFSNRGFYRFLRDHGVEIEQGRLRWVCDTVALDQTMTLLFGIKPGVAIAFDSVTEWGRTKTRRSVAVNECEMVTIPFNFRVAHNLDGRTLSVVHPRNQVAVASFYAAHSALIIYHTSISEFSIRRPVSISPPRLRRYDASARAIECDPPCATGQSSAWPVTANRTPRAAVSG